MIVTETVKKNEIVGDRRYIELSFSNLSQSTNAEIPRRALLVATIPSGGDNAVTLVASANSGQWKKGADKQVREVVDCPRRRRRSNFAPRIAERQAWISNDATVATYSLCCRYVAEATLASFSSVVLFS